MIILSNESYNSFFRCGDIKPYDEDEYADTKDQGMLRNFTGVWNLLEKNEVGK